jgi:hypothetical protein
MREFSASMKALFFRSALSGLILVVGAVGAFGQLIPDGAQNRSSGKSDAVQYLFPEQVTVAAGKSTPVALHFRIAQGLHINSHAPSDEYLIPTVFSIPGNEGVKLDAASYPNGASITLPSDPKTKLSVYTGEFIIQAKIMSPAGNHLVQGKLRYQACNDSQCLPPKTITVPIDVIGK